MRLSRLSVRFASICGALLLTACSNGQKKPEEQAGSPSGPGTTIPAAARAYGFAPDPRAPNVTYQPDVVFVAAGPAAVRGASGDGLTWRLDRNAAGVDAIVPGKVLYVSSRVAGRVLGVRPDGQDVAVTLGPVQLGEIVKNGRITFNGEVNLGTMAIQEIPDLPGLRAEIAANLAGTVTRAFLPIGPPSSAAAAPPADLPPPSSESAKEFAFSNWKGRMARESGNVVLHLEHVDNDGLKVFADLGFVFVSPHLDADLGLVDGEVGDSELRLRGLREVSLDLEGGVANGMSDNQHVKFEVPVSLDTPVVLGGLAFNLNTRFKFLVNTAFSAKNSTMSASGAWTTDGPIGFDKASGKVSAQKPKIEVKKDLVESLSGVALAASGFVFTTDIRIMLGVGIPAANAGPYGRLTTSVGLTLGSDIGFMKCRQATVAMSAGGGVGMSASLPVVAGINQVLSKLGLPGKVEKDTSKDFILEEIYNKTFTSPEKAICK